VTQVGGSDCRLVESALWIATISATSGRQMGTVSGNLEFADRASMIALSTRVVFSTWKFPTIHLWSDVGWRQHAKPLDPSAFSQRAVANKEHSFRCICTPRVVLIPSWKLVNASAAQPAAFSGLRFVIRSTSIIVLAAQAPLKWLTSPLEYQIAQLSIARISNSLQAVISSNYSDISSVQRHNHALKTS
jgi:hypothetical protein